MIQLYTEGALSKQHGQIQCDSAAFGTSTIVAISLERTSTDVVRKSHPRRNNVSFVQIPSQENRLELKLVGIITNVVKETLIKKRRFT